VHRIINGSFRDDCLNVNWFFSLENAKEKIRLFKEEYNGFRPHTSLSGLTPNEVVHDTLMVQCGNRRYQGCVLAVIDWSL
jgi:integrase-like protein